MTHVQLVKMVLVAWFMQGALLASTTKVVQVHLAKFMKVENFHKLDTPAVNTIPEVAKHVLKT